MDARDPIGQATLATLRRTYERCFVYSTIAGLAAVVEFTIVAYDGEPYRFIAMGALAVGLAALGAAIATPFIARFADEGRRRNRISVGSCSRAVALGTIACLPFAIDRAVREPPAAGRR